MSRLLQLVRLLVLSLLSISCVASTRAHASVAPAATPVAAPQHPADDEDDADEADDEEDDDDEDDADDDTPAAKAPAPGVAGAVDARIAQLEQRIAKLESLLTKLVDALGFSAEAPTLAPAAGGYESAALSISHNHKLATVRVSVNGVPVASFDEGTTMDLTPFCQKGKTNKLALSVVAADPKHADGLYAIVYAKVRGDDNAVSVYRFNSAPSRLEGQFEFPIAAAAR